MLRPFAAVIDEMYADVVGLCSVVRELVEFLFFPAPVSFLPVVAEFTQVAGIHSAIPA
jgi:hypothetical protein